MYPFADSGPALAVLCKDKDCESYHTTPFVKQTFQALTKNPVTSNDVKSVKKPVGVVAWMISEGVTSLK